MARRVRSSSLETRTTRLRLPVRKKPHAFTTVAPGIALAYRRNQGAGTWVVRCADGHGGNWTKAFGTADDHEDADGEHILDYWQACDRARALARGKDTSEAGRPATVAEAVEDYRRDLAARGGDELNARRLRPHLPPGLLSKPVSLLTPKELRRWRDGLTDTKGLKPGAVNRACKALKAALNLAAAHDQRITNGSAWRVGLAGLPDVYGTRNVILSERDVLAIVAAAYAVDAAFGLFVEVGAVTGARPSQIAGLEAGDLRDDDAPRLLMPASRKGRGKRANERKPVPIAPSLAAKLKQAGGRRAPGEPLLLKSNGAPWRSHDHGLPFAAATARAGINCTYYALRHSSIVRSLLAGVPVRVVAASHDTSVIMLEKTYSRHIAHHSDAVARKGLLDVTPPAAAANVVVPLSRAGG